MNEINQPLCSDAPDPNLTETERFMQESFNEIVKKIRVMPLGLIDGQRQFKAMISEAYPLFRLFVEQMVNTQGEMLIKGFLEKFDDPKWGKEKTMLWYKHMLEVCRDNLAVILDQYAKHRL